MSSTPWCRGEFHQSCARDLGIEREVEAGQLLDGRDARLLETAGEQAIGAAGQFVAHEQLEELQMVERAALGLLEAQPEGFGHSRQAQMP
jgi:hypothetical protein